MNKLDEVRAMILLIIEAIQRRRKSYYVSKLLPKLFMSKDLVLLYDSRFQKFLSKFQILWHGPYYIIEDFPNGSIQLKDF